MAEFLRLVAEGRVDVKRAHHAPLPDRARPPPPTRRSAAAAVPRRAARVPAGRGRQPKRIEVRAAGRRPAARGRRRRQLARRRQLRHRDAAAGAGAGRRASCPAASTRPPGSAPATSPSATASPSAPARRTSCSPTRPRSAVVIATRHASHAALAQAALRAGKTVFVEKPLALSEARARRGRRRAARDGRRAHRRLQPPLLAAHAQDGCGARAAQLRRERAHPRQRRRHPGHALDPAPGGGRRPHRRRGVPLRRSRRLPRSVLPPRRSFAAERRPAAKAPAAHRHPQRHARLRRRVRRHASSTPLPATPRIPRSASRSSARARSWSSTTSRRLTLTRGGRTHVTEAHAGGQGPRRRDEGLPRPGRRRGARSVLTFADCVASTAATFKVVESLSTGRPWTSRVVGEPDAPPLDVATSRHAGRRGAEWAATPPRDLGPPGVAAGGPATTPTTAASSQRVPQAHCSASRVVARASHAGGQALARPAAAGTCGIQPRPTPTRSATRLLAPVRACPGAPAPRARRRARRTSLVQRLAGIRRSTAGHTRLGLPLPGAHALLLLRAAHTQPDRHRVRRQGPGRGHPRRAGRLPATTCAAPRPSS